MVGGMSRMAKQELLTTIRDRYRGSSRKDKSRILDEFIAVTGHHRKHGIQAAGTNRGFQWGPIAWSQGQADLRRGGEGGGDPGVGSIGPHLRQAPEGGVAPHGGVHGKPRPPGPGSRGQGASIDRQRGHPGPVAETGPRPRWPADGNAAVI